MNFEVFTMSLLRCVSIIGDSNIQRHMNSTNSRDRPVMLNAQIIKCGRMSTFQTCLKAVRAESNVCVLSCVTNFLTSGAVASSSSMTHVVEPIFQDFLTKLTEIAAARPDVSFLICPPMYRTTPIWYREGLPEILRKFSEVLKSRPANSHMMPSFPSPSYESDGVHLTAYSGLEFVLHLFDNIGIVLSSLEMDAEARCSVASESSRVLEDRVMVLEQDHRRLNLKFEHKFAVDAELSDFQENIRCEPFLMVRGLPRLPKLEPKEWQVRAKSDVQGVITQFMGKEYPISYVMNSTGRGKDSVTQYKVRMPTAEISREVRDTFGDLFVGGDHRPPELKKISVRNCVTPATLGRIAILQLLGRRYKDSNPGSSYKVLGYEPRPLLKIFPASDTSDSRVQTYNFLEAVEKLPTNFTSSEIEDLLARISPKLHGNLKSLFVVISDDMLKKPFSKSKPESKGQRGSRGGSSRGGSSRGGSSRGGSSRGASRASKTPPAQSPGTVLSPSGSESSESFKTPPPRSSFKRGATDPASGSPATKK